jgi:hypothetical protein
MLNPMPASGHGPSPLEAHHPSDPPAGGEVPTSLSAPQIHLSAYRHFYRSHACAQHHFAVAERPTGREPLPWFGRNGGIYRRCSKQHDARGVLGACTHAYQLGLELSMEPPNVFHVTFCSQPSCKALARSHCKLAGFQVLVSGPHFKVDTFRH